MKHFLLTVFSTLTLLSANAQTAQKTQTAPTTPNSTRNVCHLGITFQISENPCWGLGEPVVLTVEPHSPADKAGIKVGDIIMEVNSTATYLRSYETIRSWLLNDSYKTIRLTIRNINTYFKEYKINCLPESVNGVSEFDLATAFSFYSLEDTRDYAFTIPLVTKINENADYSDYQTYDFVDQDNAPEVDQRIEHTLEKALAAKGLVRNTEDPDCIIQTYYTYQPNDQYNAQRAGEASKTSLRYDAATKTLVRLPIIDSKEEGVEALGAFVVKFGIRIFDKKHIDPTHLTQIWDCNVKEFLSKQYDLADYARINIPLLMMQYPCTGNKTSAKYLVSFKKYNYTGLNFDTNDMKTITSVDLGSPANVAAVKSGDKILRINDTDFAYSVDDLDDGYKRFINETMNYRNPNTRFTDAKGFPDCMFWEKKNYEIVAKSFTKSIFTPAFAYLYNFNKYVAGPEAGKPLLIQIKHLGTKKTIQIKPEIRTSISIITL